MTFTQDLKARWIAADSMLCVGLDPNTRKIPGCLAGSGRPVLDFCREIVDAVAGYCCAFKPQIAYFAALRELGTLEEIISYIHENHPGIPVILDAKRGDIGSTAEAYAAEAFDVYKADCVTLSPYMGFDTVEPYLKRRGKGVFLLCRTSNPGGRDIEMLDAGGLKVFEHVARCAAGPWNTNGEMGLVVGATFPGEMARVRSIAPTLPFLVPGIGAQGGDVNAAVAAGLDKDGWGMVINSSRAVIYAGSGTDFAKKAAEAARATRDAIRTAKEAALGNRERQ